MNVRAVATIVAFVLGAAGAGYAGHAEAQVSAGAWTQRTPWGDLDLQGEWTTEGEFGVPLERPPEFGPRQYRMKAQVLKDEFHRGGVLSRSLLMFTSALITQMVQTAACNRHHTVDQQLCRWMLLSLDRLPSSRITMTEKLIGNMLGIDRAQVSEATGMLGDAGLVDYKNGEITVVDRPGVERRTCECYGVVRRESDRLLPLSAAKVNGQPSTASTASG